MMNKIMVTLALFILASCGTKDHAGGSGVEIPNSVTVVALHGDGSPVKQAKVRIVGDSRWMYYKKIGRSVVIDSVQTNHQGEFTFVPPPKETIRIEIISENEGVSSSFDSTMSIVKLGALGSLQAQWIPNGLVHIAGTSFSQISDDAGVVSFPSIPGVHAFLVGDSVGATPVILNALDLQPGQNQDLGKIDALPPYFLVDDFEEKSIATKLNPYVNGSYWFSLADEQEGGNSSIYPSTGKSENWMLAFSDSDSYSGNSLTITYQIRPSDSASVYAILGCSFVNGINGKAIDSIAFNVATDGDFSLLGGDHTLLHGSATLNHDWQKLVVDRTELDSIGVDSTMHVLQFVFMDSAGTTFRLDDLIIYGDPFELLVNE